MSKRSAYEAVRDKIALSMTWVKAIDLQKGQFDREEENYPLPLPCALIEIKPTTWENLLKRRQEGRTVISVYLYLVNVGDTVKGSSSETDSLAMLDKFEEVFKNLTDLAAPSFQRLVRIWDGIIKYHANYVCYRTDFQTVLYEQIEPKTAPLPPAHITKELEVPIP